MGEKIKVALPEGMDLGGSYVIEWDAVDPTSGATVANVAVSDTSLLVEQLAGTVQQPILSTPPTQPGPPLIPLPPTQPGPPLLPPPTQPPPVPTPTIGGMDPDPFRWDATTAQLDPHSAALVSAFVSYALPHGAYIAPNIAYTVVEPSTQTYPVTTAGKPGGACMDATIYVPVGALGSHFHDGHLTVIDRKRGRQHDIWRTSFTNGKLTGWLGGCSIAIGQLQQPTGSHCGSNASNLNGMGGVMRPEQVSAHDLAHPLVFACPEPGQVSAATPARYPALTRTGWPYPGHLPPAAWLRFPPGLVFPAMDPTSLYTCKRIQARGMFLSDLNSSDLSVKGADLGGNLASRPAWAAAGVNLGATSGAFKLSAAIPWHSLQVLAPPHA